MSENEVKSAGADLRAMLMVGNNNGKSRGGNRGRKKNQSRISYDKDALLAIGKNAASQKRPEFLDPEYDAKPSQQALALGANPQARWDPEKWHSNTKPKRSNPAQAASPLALLTQQATQQQQQQVSTPTGSVTKENGDGWRKEESSQDQPEQRLGPQRRSFAGGCKPAQRATNEAEIILGPKRGGNSGQQEKETRAWRPSRVRDGGNNADDDKFKDFRSEKPGHQRYSAAERFGGRDGGGRGRRNFGRNYHDEEEEEVPEWMTEGPETVHEVLNLEDCVLPERRVKQVQEQRSASPELVAFDFSTGGVANDDGLGGGLEDEGVGDGLGQPQGLVDFHSKELDELLEQIDSDEGADAGVSRFSSFFNKPQASPVTMDTLSNPRSGLGLLVQQQQRERQLPAPPRPMVDPSVWQQQPQLPVVPPQQQRMAPPPQLVQDPAVLDMRSLQERTFAAGPPPNLMKMNPLMQQLQQQAPRMAPPPPTGQVMSLEELERGVTAVPESANAPAPEVKAMLLNLTRQKSDFEQKNNMQRMMLLQQPNKQQQQTPTVVPPPPVTVPPTTSQPNQYPPQLAPRTPNSFGLNEPLGGGARAINGLVGLPQMQQQQAPPPQPPPQQQQQQQRQQHNSAERERIYAYLIGEKRQRNLTPSEERFLEKNAPPPQQATELMSQMALHDEIQKQMAMMDPRNSQRQLQQQPPPPQMVNGLGARELEAHQQRQAEAQRRQQQQQQQYQDHQKGISLERQKAQFERFEKSNGDKGGAGSVSSFTTNFTPTSVMRKMVRKTGDDDGRGQRKITPLEHTGVVRVPKGASEMRLKHKQQQQVQVQQQQQQAPNRNLLSQFPPLSSINQGQPPHRQGNGAANVPPFMLQQLMFQGQQQQTQQQSRPPPPPMGVSTKPVDVFRQPPGPPRGFEQDGNIHIEKLLNQQNYDF